MLEKTGIFQKQQTILKNDSAILIFGGLIVLTLIIVWRLIYSCSNQTRLFSHFDSIKLNGQYLSEFILEQCPDIKKFNPSPVLFNGHLQTFYTSIHKHSPQLVYERQIISTQDGGQLALDWYPSALKQEDSDEVLVIILHGLTGGSQESYIQSCIANIKYKCVVIHSRGCNDSPVKTPQLFCAAYTEDVRFAVDHLQQQTANGCKLIMIGFSLGSQIMVNYLGEESQNTLIHAAISVGNPFDMFLSSVHMQGNFIGRNIYSRAMRNGLVRLFMKHKDLFKDNPLLDFDKIDQSKTVREFDELVTRRLFNYNTVNEYYRLSSCVLRLPYVRCPLICLNSQDDPVCPKASIPYDEICCNPYVTLIETQKGGHLGWFEGVVQWKSWSSKVIPKVIDSLAKVDFVQKPDWLQDDSEDTDEQNNQSPRSSMMLSNSRILSNSITALDFVDASVNGVSFFVTPLIVTAILSTVVSVYYQISQQKNQ